MLFSQSFTLETCHFQFFQLPFPQSKPVTTLSHLDLWKFSQMHLFLFIPDHWFKASSDHGWMATMGPTVSLALLSDLCIHLAHINSCLSASQIWLQSPSAETFHRKDLSPKQGSPDPTRSYSQPGLGHPMPSLDRPSTHPGLCPHSSLHLAEIIAFCSSSWNPSTWWLKCHHLGKYNQAS